MQHLLTHKPSPAPWNKGHVTGQKPPLKRNEIWAIRVRCGYCESFNGRMRDELLNGEIFYTLKEAQVIIEHWRTHYNTKRPHSALGYKPPAPEVIMPMDERPTMN